MESCFIAFFGGAFRWNNWKKEESWWSWSLSASLGEREEKEMKEKKKNWKTFTSHWSKQLVEEIGGLNEVIYGSGWVHLIRKKNGSLWHI